MTAKSNNQEHIGIKFWPPAIYPPLNGSNSVLVHTLLPSDTEFPTFDYVVNGIVNDPVGYGIQFVMPSNHGSVIINDFFTEHYTGPWPARVEVRYLKNGVPVDLGLLQIRDTRNAVPDHMVVEVSATEMVIPPHGDTDPRMIFIVPWFFDKDHIPLPFRLVDWEVLLPDPPKGVVHNNSQFTILPTAEPGEFTVHVHSPSHGFKEDIVIHLLAAT